MSTRRPRHHVTETSEVERALAEASRRWPHESRSRLDSLAGSCTGMYEPGYLGRLREDWPA